MTMFGRNKSWKNFSFYFVSPIFFFAYIFSLVFCRVNLGPHEDIAKIYVMDMGRTAEIRQEAVGAIGHHILKVFFTLKIMLNFLF